MSKVDDGEDDLEQAGVSPRLRIAHTSEAWIGEAAPPSAKPYAGLSTPHRFGQGTFYKASSCPCLVDAQYRGK